MANNINVSNNYTPPVQKEEGNNLDAMSADAKSTRLEMDRIAKEGRMDAIQAAQLAAQASRIEALGKNLKKGADAAKNLT